MKKSDTKLHIKRAYEAVSAGDGTRILVDRLWPRGVSKEKLKVAAWVKEVAPSTELRKWFGHDPERWAEFRRRYRAELKGRAEALQSIRDAMRAGVVTLVYSAHDEAHNQAVVLREWLLEHDGAGGGGAHHGH